ncbi:MFS transporter, OPA family, glycerol-3-phosphate transporter [Thermotomaculum hydrothermale]|uniref:MFS transporter, OPA family, glycerol-3-phosphate transporter n=1 Tax=Thermotomaculum hydrothermale TaxID=981385 RepID=A0A7R6PUV3_9BACT|nr:MFS transporter [Thermotomaculum hydrothermale]BBB33117.1 MFS transporter, OPA family, glycerol-3-phosphate transporter [Thermotomaculum hydrothermale]
MNSFVKSIPVILLILLETFVYVNYSHDLFVAILPFVVIAIITYLYSLNNPVGHSRAFRVRSYFNWLILGLSYASLYMGRYNLTVASAKFDEIGLMSKEAFGTIFGIGAVVYGVSFIVNGPLADKLGGKKTIIIAAVGAALSNIALGFVTYTVMKSGETANQLFWPFLFIYALNMYFQSFGAVSIVKVNAAWFHIKERGVFGGIFGTLISLGIFLAFDLNGAILDITKTSLNGKTYYHIWWAFFAPAIVLLFFAILDIFVIKDRPSQAGFEDFDTGDATRYEDGVAKETSFEIYKRILSHPVILMMIAIEFCSGVLRNGIMHWGVHYAHNMKTVEVVNGVKKLVSIADADFFFQNWGLILMVAGITGGFFAGYISDKFFGSRRGPSAFFLYFGMFIGFVVMAFAVRYQWYDIVGFLAFFMSMCVIGVHGMLSGTASMDFGGKDSAATVAGVVDGFVYLGTGFQSVTLGKILENAGSDPSKWNYWPIFLIPFTLIGLYFTWKIWNAFPEKRKG